MTSKVSFLERFDCAILHVAQSIGPNLMRFAIFFVYVWFGVLKIFGWSPADHLVQALLWQLFPFVSPEVFFVFLGVAEVIIGVLFLIPRLTRLAILLLALHMLTTFLPLVFLPELTWQSFLVPNLTGQYILKNVIILALAMSVGLQLEPLKKNC